ncbi:MAG: hypothetical protein PUC47_02015 [Oscillospiraceae bacterium]|nr:hypothetical protein [Oscillospiraceae bacterium]
MTRFCSRISRSGVLCTVGALCFTLMSLLVQKGVLPEWCFGSVIVLLLGFAVRGFVRQRDWKAFCSVSVIAGALLLSFGTVALSIPTPLEKNVGEKVKTALIALPVFWILLAGLRLWLQSFRPLGGRKNPLAAALAAGLYTIGALCLNWLRWYPSGTSPDTRHQWGQIHGTLRLNDIHALGHTIFLKGLLAIWDDYAVVILVHILMLALLYGLFAWYLAGKGMRIGWILLAVSLFTACETPTQTYMFPWKDTPYTFAVGILTLFLLWLRENRFRFTIPKAVLLGISLAYTTLFRLNGIVILLFVGIWLAVACIRGKLWKQFISIAAAVVICFAGVNVYGYQVLKAESPENGFSVQVFGSGLAAMVTQSGWDLSREDRAEIQEVLSSVWMAEHYTPWETRKLIWDYETHDPEGVFNDPNMEIMVNNFVLDLGEHKWQVVGLYLKLMPGHFLVCLRDVLYNTYKIWGLTGNGICGGWRFYYSNIFLLVVLMVGVGAVWKKNTIKRRLIVFAPMLCNVLSIAISTITNEDRYLVPTFALFPVLLLYLICTSDRPAAAAEEPSEEALPEPEEREASTDS